VLRHPIQLPVAEVEMTLLLNIIKHALTLSVESLQ
jgi:hypothetical protein